MAEAGEVGHWQILGRRSTEIATPPRVGVAGARLTSVAKSRETFREVRPACGP